MDARRRTDSDPFMRAEYGRKWSEMECDETSYDSDQFPKGPYEDGGGESDRAEHCDSCGVFLENPLTQDGYKYVREAIAEYLTDEYIAEGRSDSVPVEVWAPFYGIEVER